MATINEIKKQIDEAQGKYLSLVHTAPGNEVRAASAKVKELQRQLSAEIVKGAKPCPGCDQLPHGLEQPRGKGNAEFEIGCVSGCKPFVHTDGTVRERRVRGGMIPKHAVDAWNEGPDFYVKSANEARIAEANFAAENASP